MPLHDLIINPNRLLPSSEFAIKQIRELPWFVRVGVPAGADAVAVTSWWEAMQHATSLDWQLVRGIQQVKRVSKVLAAPPFRVEHYFRFCEEVKSHVLTLIHQKCAEVDVDEQHREALTRAVADDLLRYGQELHTEDIGPAGFYTHLFQWYTRGHFPCGWEGEYPHGRVIIY